MSLQLIPLNGFVICPVCDSTLTLVKEYDKRVALVRHEVRTSCPFYWKHYRVDRLTGYAEEFEYAQESPEVSIPQAGSSSEGTIG